MARDHLTLPIVLAAGVVFLGVVVLTVGSVGVGPGRPLDLAQADDASHFRDDAEAAVVLARLTPAEAYRLDGKRAKFLVELDGPATAEGKLTLYEVVVPGRNDMGTVWLAEGQDAEDGEIVEARLVVLHRKAWTAPSGEVVPAFA